MTVEGIDASGKTTLVGGLCEDLRRRRPAGRVLLTAELPNPILDATKSTLSSLGPEARAYAFAAARHAVIDQVSALRPEICIWDRYIDTAIVSRLVDRDLGGGKELLEIGEEVNRHLPLPHLTFLLRIPSNLLAGRLAASERPYRPYDERALLRFQDELLRRAADEPVRFHVLDASIAPDELLSESVAVVIDRLKDRGG